MRVMRDLKAERAATVVIPGRGTDRLIARLLDAGVFSIIAYLTMPLLELVGFTGGTEAAPPGDDGEFEIIVAWGPAAMSWIAFAVLAVVVAMFVSYELLSHRHLGATPGKRRTQLRIVDAASLSRATARQLVLRTVVWAVPLAFGIFTIFHSIFYSWGSFAILVAMYLWSRREGARGRPFWDVVAGTRVVTTEPPAP
jgi:hypothetical protein